MTLPTNPSRLEEFRVPDEAAGMRLDTFLGRRQTERSRTFFQQLVKDGRVLVDGEVPKRSHVLAGGETIRLDLPPAEDPWPQPQDLPLDLLHDDPDIVVVNKAAGMIVHPAAGNPDGTLVNALLHRFPDLPGINGVKRPGIVHRLDRETSGALVVAKTDRAMRLLANQLRARTMARLYVALVTGEPDWVEQRVDAPIGRHETQRIRRAVNGSGARPAVTHLKVLARAHGFALVRCRLETGRTHQIRVHCAHVGHPIAGDWLYGGANERLLERLRNAPSSLRKSFARLDRPFLHARVLRLRHPADNQWQRFLAPLPPELLAPLAALFPAIDLEELLAREVDEHTAAGAADEEGEEA
ncbi:MAG: RluA family pseudouridine synthase [Candidatus Sumerlaeia bacterium]|nr:RluA family pseudouridine synthase [Candidatus Sumerlaeia bacterium]